MFFTPQLSIGWFHTEAVNQGMRLSTWMGNEPPLICNTHGGTQVLEGPSLTPYFSTILQCWPFVESARIIMSLSGYILSYWIGHHPLLSTVPIFPSLPQDSSKSTFFTQRKYLVTTKSQVNRNREVGRTHCGVGFPECRRVMTSVCSHQSLCEGEGFATCKENATPLGER